METERLHLRSYGAGDGAMYFDAALRNRAHLAEFESDNVLMELRDEAHAEEVARELAADWAEGACYFIGLFDKTDGDWVGQVYVGPLKGETPEFAIGFVVDAGHEGRGYMREAVLRVLDALFDDLGARRVMSGCSARNTRSRRLLERLGFERSESSDDGDLAWTLTRGGNPR